MFAHIVSMSFIYLHNSYMVSTNNNTSSTSVHISKNYLIISIIIKSVEYLNTIYSKQAP